jgi:hypothetical protein
MVKILQITILVLNALLGLLKLIGAGAAKVVRKLS